MGNDKEDKFFLSVIYFAPNGITQSCQFATLCTKKATVKKIRCI